MKISFIIPVYNAEKYLVRCLDSILTVKSVEWECILIDDGSTDCSWNIICQYEKLSNRFIARRKRNGGVSSSRNLGLELCSGDRIMFVDADDYLLPEADQMFLKAVTDDYDIVLFQWAYIFMNGTKKIMEISDSGFCNAADWIKKSVLLNCAMSNCWAKLFKRSIIIHNKIRFDTTMRIAEDGCFVIEYLKYLQTGIVEENAIVYAYCQNGNSSINQFYENDICDDLRKYEKVFELIAMRGISLSIQEKQKINNIFFTSINGYVYRCAKYCSRREFGSIIGTVLNNEKIIEIIQNCDGESDTLKMRIWKILIQYKLLNIYWCLVESRVQIKKLFKTYLNIFQNAC